MRHVGSIALFGALMITTLVGCGQNKYSTSGLPNASGRLSYETTDYHAVVMVILPNGSGMCTGTFVSENAVLTAAHCALQSGEYDVLTDWGTFATRTVLRLGPGVVNDPHDIAILVFNTAVADRSEGQVYDIDTQVQAGSNLRLVGFGCDNLDTRDGAGEKRTGTNFVNSIDAYINFVTPNPGGAYGILGPDNLAGSCFGDSGGPALREVNGSYKVAGVTHAGGTYEGNIISEYVNVASDATNRNWIRTVNSSYHLNIVGF